MHKVVKLNYNLLFDLSKKVVSKHAKHNSYCNVYQEDIAMLMIEKFFLKEEHILKSFKGTASINTYCYAILNYMCLEIIRIEANKNTPLIEEYKLDATNKSQLSFVNKIFIKEEIERLKYILIMFDDESAKTELFMKYYHKLLIYTYDIKRYAQLKYKQILFLKKDNMEINKTQIFNELAVTVEKIENKIVKGDAVRIWLNKQIKTIIERLNYSRSSKYDKDTLSILLDFAYEK